MDSALDQGSYQVRFEWGVDGLRRLAPSAVVVVIDVVLFTSAVVASVADGRTVALERVPGVGGEFADGAAVARAAGSAPPGPVVIAGAFRNASAVARAVLDLQERRGERVSVAVIAAGAGCGDGGWRFAVEDQLSAGAVIDALSWLGIDHSSPEAVSAAEAFRALRGAVRHLVTAGGSGRALAIAGREAEAAAAGRLDDLDVVPVLHAGVFTTR